MHQYLSELCILRGCKLDSSSLRYSELGMLWPLWRGIVPEEGLGDDSKCSHGTLGHRNCFEIHIQCLLDFFIWNKVKVCFLSMSIWFDLTILNKQQFLFRHLWGWKRFRVSEVHHAAVPLTMPFQGYLEIGREPTLWWLLEAWETEVGERCFLRTTPTDVIWLIHFFNTK